MHNTTTETPSIGTYTASDGITHHVLVGQGHGGAWLVLDATEDLTDIRQIERLVGIEEKRETAEGTAAEYLTQMGRFLAGERDEMTVPHPAPKAVRLSYRDAKQMPPVLQSFARAIAPPPRRRAPKPADGQAALPLAA